MGWSSGSRLMAEIVSSIEDTVESHVCRVELYEKIIENFVNEDCDTLDECLGIYDAFDEAYRNLYPETEWGL
jgi:hypothetical protein